MQPSKIDDSFRLFPYRSDYSAGRTNNGGIDLTLEPWRMAEISETIDFPALRKIIEDFNMPETPFVTLGCEAATEGGVFYGYIEFTFKSESLANDLNFISKIDEDLYVWAAIKDEELEKVLRSVLAWEYSSFSYHGSSQRMKISAFYRAPNKKYAGEILDNIRIYFLENFHTPL